MIDQEKVEVPHYEMVPGTVQLIDLTGTLEVQKNGDNDIILQPQPSSNVNDPLKWSRQKRLFQFGLLWLWCFIQSCTSNFTGPLYDVYVEDLNTDYTAINNSAALCYCFLGIGVVLIQPTAAKLGKRFVYLSATIVAIIGLIVGGVATDINGLNAFNVLSGLAASPVDSLAEVSSTDMFFQHERSTAFSLLILALYAGCNLAPVAAGYIVDGPGWRWCYWIQIIIYAVLFILMFFTMEDSNFVRDLAKEDEFEKSVLEQVQSKTTSINHEVSSVVSETGVKKTYLQKINPIQTEFNDSRSWLCIFIRPFTLLLPAVIWSGLIYGCQILILALLSNTQTIIYSAKPYYFNADKVGLTNIAAFVGNIFGMLYGGYFVDSFTIKMAKRNDGILEPEHRLWTMVVPTVLNGGGVLAYGLGAYYQAHWAVSVVIGQSMLGFAMSASGAICLTYAVDSYHKIAGESIVLILFIRNMIGMIFCFVCQPWLNNCGLSLTTWLIFLITTVINGSFIIMIMYGKKLRRVSIAFYEKISNPLYGELFKKSG